MAATTIRQTSFLALAGRNDTGAHQQRDQWPPVPPVDGQVFASGSWHEDYSQMNLATATRERPRRIFA
jgi:hypothetical protein